MNVFDALADARLRGYRDALAGKSLSTPAIEEPLSLADAYYEGFMTGKGESA